MLCPCYKLFLLHLGMSLDLQCLLDFYHEGVMDSVNGDSSWLCGELHSLIYVCWIIPALPGSSLLDHSGSQFLMHSHLISFDLKSNLSDVKITLPFLWFIFLEYFLSSLYLELIYILDVKLCFLDTEGWILSHSFCYSVSSLKKWDHYYWELLMSSVLWLLLFWFCSFYFPPPCHVSLSFLELTVINYSFFFLWCGYSFELIISVFFDCLLQG